MGLKLLIALDMHTEWAAAGVAPPPGPGWCRVEVESSDSALGKSVPEPNRRAETESRIGAEWESSGIREQL